MDPVVQQVMQISEKHQGILNELMLKVEKEAEIEALKNYPDIINNIAAWAMMLWKGPLYDSNIYPPIITTRVAMLNYTMGSKLVLKEVKNWSGDVFGYYPPHIERKRDGAFSHRAYYPMHLSGSKGAVVYGGSNFQGGELNCAWLLAWHASKDGSSSKIYVEAGDLRKFNLGVIDWDDIEEKLDKSKETTYYLDDNTRAEASAQIKVGLQYGSIATFFNVSY